MITGFFASTLNKVLSGIIAALALAVGLLWWSNGRKDDRIDDLTRDLGAEAARHAVTRQSVATLQDTIAELNEMAEQRAEAFAEAQELAKEREKELAAARRSSDATIARLRELAGHGGKCAVPDELRELAEGL